MFKAVSLAVLLAGCAVDPPELSTATSALVNATFKVQGLAGKCIAIDTRANRLVLRTCNENDIDQRIRVIEREERLVELRVHENLCIRPYLGFAITGVHLEATPCTERGNWLWALDGDSVRSGPDEKTGRLPDLFIAVNNHSGADGSPLALVNRRLDESDYWEFTNIDWRDPAPYPTSGFVEVNDESGLIAELASATPGSVVQIDPDATFELHQCSISIGSRVTLRSGRKNNGRRDIHPGAGAHLQYRADAACDDVNKNVAAFWADGEDIRVTGIELEGLSIQDCRELSPGTPERDLCETRTYGVLMATKPDPYDHACGTEQVLQPRRIDVDHMDMYGWKEGAVGVYGDEDELLDEELCRCEMPTEAPSGVVSRNYFHHNRNPDGYGVAVTQDGHATIIGNTFLHNRHAISATGTSGASFKAQGNLVHLHGEGEQDFDVHGSGDGCGGARGGVAGELIDVSWNTFFGADRNNFFIRGVPCDHAEFTHNVTRQSEEDEWDELESSGRAVRQCDCDTDWVDDCIDIPNLVQHDNDFDIEDPTSRLAVHDFNGDGHDDVFMATGAAFYVSFSGQTAWQLRAFGKEQLKELGFGDFDGDGRTDVLRNGPTGNVQILYGGEGDWSPLAANVQLVDLLVGDFTGDGRADLIRTTGTVWELSSGGTSPFVWARNETRRAHEFRVGRMDADNRDDVFGVFPACNGSNDCYAFYLSGTGNQISIGPAWEPIDELSLAPVLGNGVDNIVRTEHVTWTTPGPFGPETHYEWRLSAAFGSAPFEPWVTAPKAGAVGRFDGTAAHATALVWDSLTWHSRKFGGSNEDLAWWEMF